MSEMYPIRHRKANESFVDKIRRLIRRIKGEQGYAKRRSTYQAWNGQAI